MTDRLEQRVEEMEGRYAFLDDAVQALNEVIAAQQQRIDRLEESLRTVRDTVQAELQQRPDEGPEPPPPHY